MNVLQTLLSKIILCVILGPPNFQSNLLDMLFLSSHHSLFFLLLMAKSIKHAALPVLFPLILSPGFYSHDGTPDHWFFSSSSVRQSPSILKILSWFWSYTFSFSSSAIQIVSTAKARAQICCIWLNQTKESFYQKPSVLRVKHCLF